MENMPTYTTNSSFSTVANQYDLSLLEEMEDHNYLLEVLKIFLRDTPAELKEMKQAFNAGNADIVGKKAHKIKGSAGIIQAIQLSTVLEHIEKSAKAGAMDTALAGLIDSAYHQYNNIEQALKKQVQGLR